MASRPPYLSKGRGRGQSSQKTTGYSIGNLVIDRKADSKKGKVDAKKPIVTANAKAANGKDAIGKEGKKQQVEDTRGAEMNSVADNDQESYQEQILENVIKSYKEGSNGSK